MATSLRHRRAMQEHHAKRRKVKFWGDEVIEAARDVAADNTEAKMKHLRKTLREFDRARDQMRKKGNQ